MTKLLGVILAVLAAAAFISCEEEIPFNGKYSGEKLVLFSTVYPDSGRIAVSVSSSRFFLVRNQDYQGRMVSGYKGLRIGWSIQYMGIDRQRWQGLVIGQQYRLEQSRKGYDGKRK